MQDFAAFGIFDYRTGLDDRREPWLSPLSAWETLENAFVFRGRVLKRQGRRQFGILGTPVADEVLDTSPYSSIQTGTFANTSILPHEKDPSGYSITIAEDGAAANGTTRDYPEGRGLNTGNFSELLTSQTIAASPSTTNRTAILSGGLLGGQFADSAAANVQQQIELREGVYGPSAAACWMFLAQDPYRELPNPTGFTLNWTLPSAGSVSVPMINDDVYIDGDGNLAMALPAHAHLDPAYENKIVWGPTGLPVAQLDVQWLADPGTVTADYQMWSGTVNYSTGAYDFVFLNTPTSDVHADYEYNKGNEVMGIRGFFTQDGSEYLIALDTEELWQWNNSELRFYRQTDDEYSTGTTFNGDNDDYFWFEVFETYAVLTNGVDRVQKYDPAAATTANMGTTFNPDSGDFMESAKMAIRDRNRLVYLDTLEPTTTEWKQRARWTPVNSVEYTGATAESEDDFVDAPTEHTIKTGFRVGDDIVVGFSKSWWRLRYTADPELPYEWERLLSEEGASARMGFFIMPEQAIAQGENSIVGIDGVSVRPVDYPVPDMVRDEWNFDARQYSFAYYSKENRVGLMSYVRRTETLPQSVLAIHVDETRSQLSYADYEFPFADDDTNGLHCFGEYRQSTTLTHDTVDEPHNQIQYSHNDAVGVQGFPQILAGDRNSTVWHIFPGVYDDDRSDVTMKIRTKRLNPYITPQAQMQRCQLGYVSLQMDAVSSGSITFRIYADYDDGPYLEQTIDLQASDGTEKVFRRILVNRAAMYHSLEIEYSSQTNFALDSMWLYAKPAGIQQAIA